MIITGDVVEFGRYEQGNGVKPIEWLVLDHTDKGTLLISKYGLDAMPSNGIPWETCTLRRWLNKDFLNAAFNAEEQAMISKTRVTADKNPKYDTRPGKSTEDKIFLLSVKEVKIYFSSDEDRRCAPTDYAIAHGAWANDIYETDGRATGWWWLRSPGGGSFDAARVNFDGSVLYYSYYVDYSYGVVRPALWVQFNH